MNAAHSAIAAGGLVLDIAGALLLAVGLMFKTPKRAINEATPRYDFNVELDANVAMQTADAQVGALLLVSGFAAQFASSLGVHATTWWDIGLAIGAAAAVDAVATLFLFWKWRRFHIRRMLGARLESGAELWITVAAYGPVLGTPAPADIGVESRIDSYAERVLGRRRWRRYTQTHALLNIHTELRRDLPGTTEYAAAHPHPGG